MILTLNTNIIFRVTIILGNGSSEKDETKKQQRYLFYDVNMGEGFNLRRDVFMRVAVFVKNLNINSNDFQYTLVLPPWGRLYHWQSRHLGEQVRYVSVYHLCMSDVALYKFKITTRIKFLTLFFQDTMESIFRHR